MAEMGIPYIITGPDGSRAAFNSPADADFVGYLDPENGITGLLDSADVRVSRDNKVEGDGTYQGNNYLAARVGTLQGMIWPDPDMSAVNARRSKMLRAARALRADSYMTWQPSGYPLLQLRIRREGKITVGGRRPKQFQMALSSPDPYVYSAALNSLVLVPTTGAGDVGITSPISSPLSTVYQQSGQLSVSNIGDVETWPLFRIDGPITNPTLRNNTTGQSFTLTYTLAAGEYLMVDTLAKSVLLAGTTNRYGAFAANFAANQWWSLQSGSNDVRLLSSAFSAGAQVTVYWRHAWE